MCCKLRKLSQSEQYFNAHNSENECGLKILYELVPSMQSIRHQIERLIKWLTGLPQKHFLLILAIVVGFMAGMVAVILKNLVYLVRELLTIGFTKNFYNILYFFYPLVGLLLTVYIVKRVLKKEPGSGIPVVLSAISKRQSTLKRHNIYSALLTSFVTVGFGGSAGLEAPSVQTSAALGSNLGAAFKLNHKTRTLLIGCAAAGSMASMFQAPVAAIVFAVEVIMIDLTTATMVPILLASISALITTTFFLSDSVLFNFDFREKFSFSEIHYYVLLGIFTGIFSVYFNRIFLGGKKLASNFKNPYKKALAGGLLLGILIFVFPPLYGEGYEMINAMLSNDLSKIAEGSVFYDYRDNIYVMLLFLAGIIVFKVIATTITLNTGGIGGIFAPSLFVGASLGYFFSRFFSYFQIKDLPVGSFTLVGMAGLLAGVLHAPLTSIFLIAELAGGYDLFVPLMLTAAISYYTAKAFNKHSIFNVELAERGELITHNKDQAVLTLMNLSSEIDRDFKVIHADQSLGELVQIIAKTNRNVFPVLDPAGNLLGIVTLDDIRQLMFDSSQYGEIKVHTLMSHPPEIVYPSDKMYAVMSKFDFSGAWYLPVLDGPKYIGFVSKSRILAAYRKKLVEYSNDIV